MDRHRWYEDVPIARLLRDARGAYGDAVRRSLVQVGFDDIPQHGGAVLAGVAWRSRGPDFTAQAEAVAFLRLSKQRSSQLVDTLVLRGYLERRIDPEDRRRMRVRLTERGRAAAVAISAAVEAIDAQLEGRLTADEFHGLQAGLGALAEIRDESGDVPD
jgi:DNA-binding MarR family transcriptional regulator